MRSPSIPLRNTLAYAVPELFWGFAWALTVDGPMIAAYRDAFHADTAFVGLAWVVASLAIGLPGLLTAHVVEPMTHKRGFVLWGHVVGGIALVLGALAVHQLAPLGTTAACAAWLVAAGSFFLTIGVVMPGWLALVGELFDGGMQSRLLGITFVSNKIGGFLAGRYVASLVLEAPWSAADRWSFLFLVAGLAALVGSAPFLWIVESPRPRPPREPLRRYLTRLRSAWGELPALRRYIGADMVGMVLMLVLVYAADAAIHEGRAPRARAGHWVAVGAVGMLCTSALVAWRARTVHPRTWFLGGTAAGVLAALAAAYGTSGLALEHGASLLAFDVAAVGVGVYLGVRVTCHAPLVMRLSPGRDGTAPIGLAVACIMAVQGVAPPVAAVLIESRGYLPMFLGVASCGLLSFILLLLRVPGDVSTGEHGNDVSGTAA